MSSREPMWYCHECHAEMRPLMVPDPVCASCNGSFVEKIEDPSNDPRNFANGGGPGDTGDMDGFDTFLIGLQTLLNRGMQQNQQRSSSPDQPGQRSQAGSRMTFQIRSNSGPRQATFTFGPSSPLSGSPNPNSPPTMSEFLRSAGPPPSGNNNGGGNRDHPSISGPLFAQYLMSLLGQTDHHMFIGGMPESGRMGDYVFSQEALDQIITQIMENSNSSRPVPATEEIIQKLPREVLVEGSPLLSKDCAVCKDQFQLATEDPDEQVVVELPCKHPFHQPCILPWLNSSGTCPVCRYALVPQPDQSGSRNNATTSNFSPTSTSTSSSVPPFNAGSNSFNYNSSQPSASRTGPQSPAEHRGTGSGGRSSSESHQSGSGPGVFTQLLRNLAGPMHGHGSGGSLTSPPNSPPLSSSPRASSPPSSPFGSASGPTRTRDPSRRHMYRSSMDSSVPFFPRSSATRQQSQQRNRNQGSDGGGSGGAGGGNETQNGRPHVPGQWDDMMDLD